jgi:hypothetical protein
MTGQVRGSVFATQRESQPRTKFENRQGSAGLTLDRAHGRVRPRLEFDRRRARIPARPTKVEAAVPDAGSGVFTMADPGVHVGSRTSRAASSTNDRKRRPPATHSNRAHRRSSCPSEPHVAHGTQEPGSFHRCSRAAGHCGRIADRVGGSRAVAGSRGEAAGPARPRRDTGRDGPNRIRWPGRSSGRRSLFGRSVHGQRSTTPGHPSPRDC